MSLNTKIEWTDRTWNPIRGCTRVSPGCGGPGPHGGCYAETMAGRFSDPGQWGHGFATRTPAGGRWTGGVAVQWDRMDLPLRWRKPAKIFANSTSDWFHEKLPAEEIATLFAVAVAAVHIRRHTIQILTKRADRMREVLTSEAFWDQVNAEAGAHVMEHVDPLDRRSDDARATLCDYGPENPPPGIWLGVSAEDQARFDERAPHLAETPAVVRFISFEPLLGPIDMRNSPFLGRFDWAIVGAESGRRARAMNLGWAIDLHEQCRTAGIWFFMKQISGPGGRAIKGMGEFPSILQVREFPSQGWP